MTTENSKTKWVSIMWILYGIIRLYFFDLKVETLYWFGNPIYHHTIFTPMAFLDIGFITAGLITLSLNNVIKDTQREINKEKDNNLDVKQTDPPPNKEIKRDTYLKKAVDAYNNKNYEEAILWFDKCIKSQLNLPVAYYGKGITLCILGREEEAVKNLELAIYYGHPKAASILYLKKAVDAYNNKNYEEAILWFDKCIKSQLNLPAAYYGKGIALYHLGRKKKAIKNLELAIYYGHPKAASILKNIKKTNN